jgi:hypothetical protein
MIDETKKFAAFTAIFLVGGALGIVLAPLVGQSGAGGKVTFGDFYSIEVAHEKQFYDLFKEAYNDQPERLAHELRSALLLVKIPVVANEASNGRELSQEEQNALTFAEELRPVLINMEGPFGSPYTLAGAKAQFMDALTDLERLSAREGEASEFLAEVWKTCMDRKAFCRGKLFNGTVQKIDRQGDAGRQVAFACPGYEPETGRLVEIFLPDFTASVPAMVEQDETAFRCSVSESVDFAGMFAGTPAKLGLSAIAWDQLFGDEAGADAERPVTFQIMPKNTQPIVMIE